jgi:hypothetical protein
MTKEKTHHVFNMLLILGPSTIYASCPISFSLEATTFTSFDCQWFNNFQQLGDQFPASEIFRKTPQVKDMAHT